MKTSISNIIQKTMALGVIVFFSHCKVEVSAPILKSVDPTKGIIGDQVTIMGENLESANGFTFNTKPADIVQNTSTSLVSFVPQGSAVGINDLTVQTAGGTSNKLQFEVIKDPAFVDSLPPEIEKTIPSANYTDYPVLIYGNYLSGIISISFDDKVATIMTSNQRVVTTTIPKGLTSGTVIIKIRTKKGISSSNFQVLGPPPGGVIPVNFSVVTIPPPNYVQAISNQWSCGLFSEQQGDRTFVDLNTNDGNDSFNVTGRYEYHFDKTKSYNNLNYVEFTNKETGETLAGQFSSKYANPCILEMVLISSKTGKISYCTFDRRSNEPDLQCDN